MLGLLIGFIFALLINFISYYFSDKIVLKLYGAKEVSHDHKLYKIVKELVEQEVLDFVALDYKAPKDKFFKITSSNKYDEFSQTLNFLLKSSIDFEIRTTLHKDLLNTDDINNIIDDLVQRGYKKNYYIQKFQHTSDNIGNIGLESDSFDSSKLLDSLNIVWR